MTEHRSIVPLAEAERAALESMRGVVFDVQRYSVHDGPGLRTNVFLKGCPLRCGWCANPESQHPFPEPFLRGGDCIHCELLDEPCSRRLPAWIAARKADPHETVALAEINERVRLCATGALYWAGATRSASDVLAEVLRDRPFYGKDGGLTLTGGEPTMQPAFCEALLRLARAEGIATAMETCGHTQWEIFDRLWPLMDTLLFDLKHVDNQRHLQHTGMDNHLILDNLDRLAAAGAPLRIRVPVIPGFNAAPREIAAIVAHVKALPGPVQGVDLLPYHALGKAKYAGLGRDYPWEGHTRLSDGEVAALADIVSAAGLPVHIGG